MVVDNEPIDAAGQVAGPPPAAIPEPFVRWEPPAAPASTRLVPGTTGLEYAGAVPRVAAYLLDGLLLILAAIVLVIVVGVVMRSTVVAGVLLAVIQAVYFVASWRSSSRGTLGMRAFKLQIGRMEDGQPITAEAGIVRWFVLTGWTSVVSLVTALGNLPSVLALIWSLVLLVSTSSDARRQGLHDKLTGTAIVRPVGQSDTGAWATLILLIVLPVVLALFAIVALIFLGAQVSNILSTVGQSVGQ